MKVLGIEKVDYESRKTGRRVTGRKVFYTEPLPAARGEGFRCDSEYVSASAFGGALSVGDEISFLYDRWGHVAGVSVIA